MLNKFLSWVIRPKKGEVFIPREKSGNPFMVDNCDLVTIVEVKSGWVKFDWSSVKGASLSMIDFWLCFKRYKEQ